MKTGALVAGAGVDAAPVGAAGLAGLSAMALRSAGGAWAGAGAAGGLSFRAACRSSGECWNT